MTLGSALIFPEETRTRQQYAFLPKRELLRLIASNHDKQETCDTDEEWHEAAFAIRELHAVLEGEY